MAQWLLMLERVPFGSPSAVSDAGVPSQAKDTPEQLSLLLSLPFHLHSIIIFLKTLVANIFKDPRFPIFQKLDFWLLLKNLEFWQLDPTFFP